MSGPGGDFGLPDAAPRGRERPSLRKRLRRPGWKVLGLLLLAFVVWNAPGWTRPLLAKMDFFRLRRVEVRGTRYLNPDEIVARLRVDTTQSVWNDLRPLQRRLRGHPQIRTVEFRRRLPRTIVVEIVENLPVALVSTSTGIRPFDSSGRALPIDPSRTPLDLPVLYSPDPRLIAALGAISHASPELFARISSARRDGGDAMMLDLESLRVRAQLGVSGNRLSDIFPVESDLARRGVRAAEIDLRYRDQVIARLQ